MRTLQANNKSKDITPATISYKLTDTQINFLNYCIKCEGALINKKKNSKNKPSDNSFIDIQVLPN